MTAGPGRTAASGPFTPPGPDPPGATIAEEAVLNALAGTLDVGLPYPLPSRNAMPAQETTPARPPVQ
jgi:phospholipase C